MIFSVMPGERLIDWSKLHDRLPRIMSYAFVFALGGWVHGILIGQASLPYWQRSAHQVEQIKAATGQTPQAAIACQKRRAEVAEVIAGQALAIANFDATPKELLREIPDCPKESAAK